MGFLNILLWQYQNKLELLEDSNFVKFILNVDLMLVNLVFIYNKIKYLFPPSLHYFVFLLPSNSV